MDYKVDVITLVDMVDKILGFVVPPLCVAHQDEAYGVFMVA